MIRILGRVLWILRSRPAGVNRSLACRILNDKTLDDCVHCIDYGNKWKKRRGILSRPTCQIRRGQVWRALRRLEDGGLVHSRIEKWPDTRQPRGWDFMRIYYLGPQKN